MALTMFKAFRSTVTAFTERMISSSDRWLVDPVTGAITGVQNPNANGPDARFVPVDITGAQLLAPSPAMIADLDATYRMSVPPYSRYQSDGTQLVAIGGGGETETVIPPGMTYLLASPFTVAFPQEIIVEGGIKVLNLP